MGMSEQNMKVLFIGDIVGDIGLNTVETYLPRLKRKYNVDVVIANGENAADGRGITKRIYQGVTYDGCRCYYNGKSYLGQKRNF